ncbi:Hsp20/alpha crystallin family protein [Streptomyces sp. NPDC006208]|uniref:Hsp20/alpha crystallin family protein n=1 Tax=Streptomyces sp. NPDC006208 TaxID=3156734 RepID=UPI0033B56950
MELELPGVGKDHTVEATDSELDIHGETAERESNRVVRRHIRYIGQFDYCTSLPANSGTEYISGELINGVLAVRVPKAE